MIHRILSSLIIAMFLLIFGSTVGPGNGTAFAAGGSASVTASTTSFEGLLVVKEADGVFLVRSETGDTKRLKIDENTTVTRNGKPAQYSDLRSRDHIRVQYNASFVATNIDASGS